MDEVHGIKTEPELDLTDFEFIGVQPENISNLLIENEFEYQQYVEESNNILAIAHDPINDLICSYYLKVLSSKQSLRGHLRTHTGEFYTCDYCPRKFTRKADLKYHINTHTGETLFKCLKCPRTYSRKCLLRYHEKKHGIELGKPLLTQRYSSEMECHEQLPSEVTLDTHLQKQSFRFGCNLCGVKFSKKSNLDLHLITHTNAQRAKEHTIKNIRSRRQKTSFVEGAEKTHI